VETKESKIERPIQSEKDLPDNANDDNFAGDPKYVPTRLSLGAFDPRERSNRIQWPLIERRDQYEGG
jgi:hypothetical protein